MQTNSAKEPFIRSPASFAGAATWMVLERGDQLTNNVELLQKLAEGRTTGWEQVHWFIQNADWIKRFDIYAAYPKDLSNTDLARFLFFMYKRISTLYPSLIFLRDSAIRGYAPAILEAALRTSPNRVDRHEWPVPYQTETERWRTEALLLGYEVDKTGHKLIPLDPETLARKGDVYAMEWLVNNARGRHESPEHWFWECSMLCANRLFKILTRQDPETPAEVYQAGLCLVEFGCNRGDYELADSWMAQYQHRHDGAQSAVFAWALVAMRIGIPFDVHHLVSKLVWDHRVNWPVPPGIVVKPKRSRCALPPLWD